MKSHRVVFPFLLATLASACGETTAAPGPMQQVLHGEVCSSEGSTASGTRRSCTDSLTLDPATCVCKGGRYDCGSCPTCEVDLRRLGCGLGAVCDGVTFTRCDGSTVSVTSTCTCDSGRGWNCDGNAERYAYCSRDAAAEATTDAPDTGADAPDAGADAPDTGTDAPDTSTDAPDTGTDASSDARDGCAAPVSQGTVCSAEGATACGYERICTDVGGRLTTCTCRNGHFWCGDCPSCRANLREPQCGAGLVCDGLTLQQCDSTTFTTDATCSCVFNVGWVCSADGGTRTLAFCPSPEGGAGD